MEQRLQVGTDLTRKIYTLCRNCRTFKLIHKKQDLPYLYLTLQS